MSEQSQLASIAAGTVAAAVLFHFLDEAVYSLHGFKFGSALAVAQSVTYVALAALDMRMRGVWQRQGTWTEYLILSALTTCSTLFWTW